MEIIGVDDVMNKISHLMEHSGEVSEMGMLEFVADLGANAAERAPIKDGYLRGSMTFSVETDGDTVTGEVRFTEKYAAVQHERVDFHHPLGGEAKYLERAALDKYEQLKQKIADRLGEVFK